MEDIMRGGMKKLSTLFLIALLFGCASREESTRFQAYRPAPGYSVQEQKATDGGKAVVATAKKAIGTPYVLGGTKPGGFDCSGLVMWAYQNVGVKLPRTAREQSAIGEKIQDKKAMLPGDIVAFHHPRRGYHTGIYIGDGKFIHSPRKRSSVKISSLDSEYFKSTLLGARRVKINCDDTILYAASQLPEYKAGAGYQEITDTPTARLPKLRKKAAPTRKAAKAAKKTASSKAVASKKSAKTTKAAQKSTPKNAKKTVASKKAAKTAPQNAKRAKASQTAQIKKKSAAKTVSMLHKKSR